MRFLRVFLASLVVFAALAGGRGAEAAEPGESAGRTRIAIVEFAILDDKGDLTGRDRAPSPDLARLVRLMPTSIAARLAQSGDFDVTVTSPRGGSLLLLPEDPQSVPVEARALLLDGRADEVVTGTVGTLQATVVVTAQRYGRQGDEVVLVGAAAAPAPRIGDALALVDALIHQLFPPEAQVLDRTIEQLFIIPASMRLPIGQSKELSAFAIDAFGRPLTRVQFLFQSNDSSRVVVDEQGVVSALSPGQATITVRAVGLPTRGVPTATAAVTVVPPAFGVRVGPVVGGTGGALGEQYRIGLRLTPTVDVRPTPRPRQEDLVTAANNPLSYLSNFFSALLTEGLFTMELDFEPGQTMTFTLSAVQRARGGFFGTGVGFATPLRQGGAQGLNLRLTLGTHMDLLRRTAVPLEINADLVFPTSVGGETRFRVGVSTGFDLFQ